ncbi:MAG: type II secretion system F family protein [Beijerinckiaceae bacterium]|nr:type II secretion system F family protein [Beijerinckiaceae bacterium]
MAVMSAFVYANRMRLVRRRLSAVPVSFVTTKEKVNPARALVAKNFDEKYFKLEPNARNVLRMDLIKAGYFSSDAVPVYLAVRFGLMLGMPAIGLFYGAIVLPTGSLPEQLLLCGLLFVLASYGPNAYLKRRQGKLQMEFRNAFPDMMDWLLVCVDAGLSLEAAIDRVASEMAFFSPALGVNLTLVGAEVRAGRSTIEALQSFSERVQIEEAESLVTLMRQSVELGTSVGRALRIFSEEMRDRRMSRAEERAHQLPVKLMIPLSMFIFPNIMLVLFLPIVVRFMKTGLIPQIN